MIGFIDWISSVEFEFLFPVCIVFQLFLVMFVEQVITHYKIIDLRAHEAAECVVRSADDRFSPYVETGVDDYCIACEFFEIVNELPVSGICVAAHALQTGRVIDMGNRRHVGAEKIEAF